jgi:DNA-binding response OmpR family regulator
MTHDYDYDLTRLHIHILNDDEDLLALYQEVLAPEGFQVTIAKLPFAHPQEIEQLKPSVVILDLKFGHQLEGWKLLQMLRMYTPTAGIPIIICTAAVREAREQEDFLQSRGITVVYKPFELDELLAAVRASQERSS